MSQLLILVDLMFDAPFFVYLIKLILVETGTNLNKKTNPEIILISPVK
jgi:hypothetical protein